MDDDFVTYVTKVGHSARRFISAIEAVTLTNNPAPGLQEQLEAAAADLDARMHDLFPHPSECAVLPNTVYELAPYGGEEGGTAEVRLKPDGTPIVHVLSTI